jgi:hypothetical protein
MVTAIEPSQRFAKLAVGRTTLHWPGQGQRTRALRMCVAREVRPDRK